MWGNGAPHSITCLGRPRPRCNESLPLLHCSWTRGSLQRGCLFVQQSNRGGLSLLGRAFAPFLFGSLVLCSVPISPPSSPFVATLSLPSILFFEPHHYLNPILEPSWPPDVVWPTDMHVQDSFKKGFPRFHFYVACVSDAETLAACLCG